MAKKKGKKSTKSVKRSPTRKKATKESTSPKKKSSTSKRITKKKSRSAPSKEAEKRISKMTKGMTSTELLILLTEQEERIIQKELRLKQEEDRILQMEKRIEQQERRILREEEQILKEEHHIQSQEESTLKVESNIQEIEKQIEHEITERPLVKVTFRDVYRAIIGAVFGVVAHFAFSKGLYVAEKISLTRATLILIVTYFLGVLLIDGSGFRKVREQRLLKIIPVRVTVIYLVSIAVVIVVLAIFNQIYWSNFIDTYKQVAVVSILAMMGAASADIIGHHHE